MSTFVDETKLYCIVKFLLDQLALQQDLNNIMGWGEDSQISFNFDQCHSMSFWPLTQLCNEFYASSTNS